MSLNRSLAVDLIKRAFCSGTLLQVATRFKKWNVRLYVRHNHLLLVEPMRHPLDQLKHALMKTFRMNNQVDLIVNLQDLRSFSELAVNVVRRDVLGEYPI